VVGVVSERAMARPRIGLRLGDIARLVAVWLVSSAALALADALLPNLTAEAAWTYLAATAVAGLLGLVFRPAVVLLAARTGWIVVVVAGLVGQALVVYAAIWIAPGINATFLAAFVASWIVAGVGTAAAWLCSAGTDDSFTASLLRRRVDRTPVADPDVDGVVFVQLDGVAFPVLRWAVQAGAVPTLRRWVTSGDYVLREWTAQLPCTTPASQLGILHGTVAGVPAFRWYDRELGRVLIANRPDDAAIIEQRATTGAGLLSDDGLSVGNLFTGDAPRAVLTMSRLGSGRGSAIARQTFAWFLTNPNGFTRGLVRTVAEVAKERWQAARQNRLNVLPRVHRGWTFAGLRAATNVLQRDLNTAVVAEAMRKGTKSIYVDYVDYDEIAHHAGMFRLESLAALDGLDRVLGTLERLSTQAARRYHIVVVSDHGQSQGQTFLDRFGADLGDVCTRLMEEEVASLDAPVEGWGRVDSLAKDLAGTGITGRAAGRAAAASSRHVDQGAEGAPSAGVSVLGSGNLGLLYVHSAVRLTLEDLQERWPSLVPGLCAHEGVGFIAGLDSAGVPWVLGEHGRIQLDTGEVTGRDPLEPYGDHAARVLRRAVAMPEAPDLYINSRVGDVTLDIAAFEPLVGAHGGLGGWQDRAVLLTPRTLADVLPAEHIEGADRLHAVLMAMLRAVGQRKTMPDSPAQQGGRATDLSTDS
jgi:Type I phosphodiesterase / nucleotide pyrophosphatase/Mycobacterial 4 TMS phage holin, superfamily IV